MGLTVTFTDLSTPVGLIAEWAWDFGDGSDIDGSQNPVHTYALAGTYSVTLYVLGIYGAESQITLPVTVGNPDPCALTWDFTLSDQGWAVVAGKEGIYVPGSGFLFTDVFTAGGLSNGLLMFHYRGVHILSPTFAPFPALPFNDITLTVHATLNDENAASQNTGKRSWRTTHVGIQGFTAAPAVPIGSPPPAAVAVVLTAVALGSSGLLHDNTYLEIELDSSAFQPAQNVYRGSVLITSVSLVCS